MKRILKSSKKKWVRNNKGKRFFYKCLTAMPGRSSKGVPYILPKWSKPYFIYGRSTGQQLLKKDNICRFESAKEQLEHSRSKILSELLNVKGVNMTLGETDEGDLSNQWKACTTLGIDVGVLNLLIEDAKSECNGGCSGTHSNSEFIRKLNSTGIFEIEDGENYVRLKNINELTDQQKKVFGEKIDYYLHFDLIKKLRYQERGIDAHLWQFRSFNKKTF